MTYTLRSRESHRGAALLELALILPVLAVLAVGVSNLGIALGEKQIIVEAARYGARRAAADGSPDCDIRPAAGAPVVWDFTRCDTILSSEVPADRKGPANPLARFYSCQFLQQSGMDPRIWNVASVNFENEYPATITVRLERAEPANFFVSAIMGPTFPMSDGSFALSGFCGPLLAE